MAYVADQNDPNAQNQAPIGAAMAQLPQTSSGAGAGATGTNVTPAGSPQGAAAVPATTKAPPVQDLQAYLAANAPQTVQMGQNIAGSLNQTANQVTGDINAAQQDLNTQVNASNVAPNAELVGRAAANPSEFVNGPADQRFTPENPYPSTDLTAFQAQANANYTGPTSFETTPYNQTLTGEVNKAVAGAPDINKPGGVEQLVTGQEQNPTLGMRNLDTLLLQQTPEAMAPIQQAIPQFGNLGNYLSTAQTSTNAAIQKAIANDQAAKAGVNTAFLTGPNAVVPAIEDTIKAEVTKAQTDAQMRSDAVKAALGLSNPNDAGLVYGQNPKVSDQTLSDLGITRDQLQILLAQKEVIGRNPNSPSIDLSKFLGLTQESPQAKITAANAASQKDYETEAALQKLLGGQFTTPYLDQANVGQAGTAPLDLSSIDPDQIQTLLNLYQTQPGIPAADKPGYQPPTIPGKNPDLGHWVGNNPIIPDISKPDNRPIGFGNGTPYIDPKTGETKIAY